MFLALNIDLHYFGHKLGKKLMSHESEHGFEGEYVLKSIGENDQIFKKIFDEETGGY